MVVPAGLRGWPRPLEVVLALAVLVPGTAETVVPFASRQGTGDVPTTLVTVVALSVALLWARRVPLLPICVVAATWLVVSQLSMPYILFYGGFVPIQIAVFMGARFAVGRGPVVTAGVAAVTLLSLDLSSPAMRSPGELAFHWTVTALVWSAGFGLRTLEHRAHESTRRAVEAEVNAAAQALQAVVDERTRIARELHDIVGHAVSSMVVQAGAAEQAVDDQAFVERALGNIRSTGNDALAEMRRLVSILRTADDAPYTPQPRLDALPALVSGDGGPQVRLTVTGDVRPLPAGLDLTLYRIVQEALTNVRRHSGAASCEVTLAYEQDRVRVCVVDDGRGAAADHNAGHPAGHPADDHAAGLDAGGHGLVGMRERAALYGGELLAGPEPEGGFAVRATLPVAP